MNELDFIIWLMKNNTSKKMCSDYVSRLKKIEHYLSDCDLDEEYSKDHCYSLLKLFDKSGQNEKMNCRHIDGLPIGKYYLATYKYSIKKYIEFMNYFSKSNLTK